MIDNYALQIQPLLGLLGTQELFVLIYLFIPIAIIYLVFRFFRKLQRQNSQSTRNAVAAEINRLFLLKEKGVLTQQEFDTQKSKLPDQ